MSIKALESDIVNNENNAYMLVITKLKMAQRSDDGDTPNMAEQRRGNGVRPERNEEVKNGRGSYDVESD